MTHTEVKDAIAKLHAERGDFRTKELTIPGKGHWMWGLYTRMYVDRGLNECWKQRINPNNTSCGDA